MRARFAATTVLAVATSLVVGIWLSVTLLVELDHDAGGQFPSRLVISELAEGVSSADAREALGAAARSHTVNIALLVPDVNSRGPAWDRYLFTGNPSDSSLQAPPFDPSVTIRTHQAWESEDLELRGMYAVTVRGSELDALVSELNREGLHTSSDEFSLVLGFASVALEPGSPLVVSVVALGSLVAIAAEALQRRRQQAVRRSLGWSRPEMLVREAGELSLLLGGAALGLAAVGTVCLSFYNGFAGVGRLVPLVGYAWGATLPLVMAAYLGVQSWPRIARTAGVFAGQSPTLQRRLLPRLVCVLLVALTVSGLVGSSSSLASAQLLEGTLSRRAPLADTARIGVGVATVSNEAFDRGFGKVVRSELSARQALFAGHDDSPNYPNGPFGPNHLLVNRAYLKREPVRDINAQPLHLPPSSPRSFDILIPVSLEGERDRIVTEFEEWLDFQKEFTGAVRPSTVRIQLIADGQDTPDFGDGDIPGDVPTRTGNVIAVVSDDASAIADEMLSSYAGNGQMLFTDPASLRTALDRSGFAGAITAIDRYGDTIIRQLVEIRAEIARLLTASVMALIVLAFATWSSVAHHGVRRRVERRVLTLTGRSRWAAHVRYLVTSTTLSATVATFAAALVGATTTAFAAGAVCVALDTIVRLIGIVLLARRDGHHLRNRLTAPRRGSRPPVTEQTA